jgi:ATP-binding cassette, subfamily B, bacterial
MTWRASPGSVAGQAVVALTAGLAPVAAAWLLRAILDDVARAATTPGRLLSLAVLLSAAGGVIALAPNLTQYLSARCAMRAQRQAMADLFAVVSGLPGLRRLEDPGFADRLRVAEQGTAAPGQLVTGGVAIAQSALTVGGFLATLLVLSPLLAGVVAAAAVPAIVIERAIARQHVALISGTSHAQRRQNFYQNLLTSLDAAKEIRLFGLGRHFGDRMLGELSQVQAATDRVNRRALYGNAAMACSGALVSGGGLIWAVSAAAGGHLTVGDVSILFLALGAVAAALSMLINTAAMGYQALLMFECFRGVVAVEADLPLPADPVLATALRSGITIEDVWFRYSPDGPWILRGVSCFIPHGQAVALVGHNGAGKSTLVKLLCRFYDPDRGRILWDGIDLRELDLAGFRDRLSVVFQDYMAYELTAAENIEVGDLAQAGQQELLATAAQRAGAHETLAGLPRGYSTLLTRGFYDLGDQDNPQAGVQLSGGQWQRVALARAFLRGGRDLMILDEPSSGLDAQAEHDIHVSLAASRPDCATMLISHRLNTVRDADQIVVLSDGVITERGDHDSLMASAGTYARLFSLQARGFSDAMTGTTP